MESHDEFRSDSDLGGSEARAPEGKLRRIASDMQGLVEDLQRWIDLRLDLTVLELEERLDRFRNDLALGVVVAVFGFFAAFFGLTTVALGIGWALGRPFWGFLAVTLALGGVVGVLRLAKPEVVPPSNLFETVRGAREETNEDDEDPSQQGMGGENANGSSESK